MVPGFLSNRLYDLTLDLRDKYERALTNERGSSQGRSSREALIFAMERASISIGTMRLYVPLG